METTERITRAKAIRLKCLDCCGQLRQEVKECPVTKCPLWRYRLGNEIDDELRPVRPKKINSES